jgi:hypothetical protein
LVLPKGAQLELIDQRRAGLSGNDPDDLVRLTRTVIDDPALENALSVAAVAAVEPFLWHSFSSRLRSLAADLPRIPPR